MQKTFSLTCVILQIRVSASAIITNADRLEVKSYHNEPIHIRR